MTDGLAASTAVDDWRKKEVERFMRDAEEAIRLGDLDMARTHYWGALRFDPQNIIARMRLGLALKKQGNGSAALEEFTTVTKFAPDYAEAWKEKGILEGQIARRIPKDVRNENMKWLADGSASLKRATLLNPDDFDAWSSLGGIFKNVHGDLAGAKEMYAHAADISDGHPYPLLNALKLEAQHTGKLDLKRVREQLKDAEKLRLAQTLTTPPTDTPWCYFDLAELRLYQRDENGFLEHLKAGIQSSTAGWQVETCRNTLDNTLVARGIQLPGLSKGIKLLDDAIASSGK
ncbi:MAG: hypothetical protein AAF441_17560 [Pseudomonadota bacterium]